MSGRRQRIVRMSLIERALMEKQWHATAVRAQIHAITGDDGNHFVDAAGRILWVVLEAAITEQVDPELPEIRIIRGACNSLEEQAGVEAITPARRASIRAGLEACDRLIEALPRKALIDGACELHLRLNRGAVNWSDFQARLQKVAA